MRYDAQPINHGMPEHMTEGALEMAKGFFSLPIEAKMGVGCAIIPITQSLLKQFRLRIAKHRTSKGIHHC